MHNGLMCAMCMMPWFVSYNLNVVNSKAPLPTIFVRIGLVFGSILRIALYLACFKTKYRQGPGLVCVSLPKCKSV